MQIKMELGVGRGDRGGRNGGHGGKGERDSGRGQPHTLLLTYCTRHGEGQGHNTSDCIVIRRELDRHNSDFHPYSDRFPGGHGHEQNRHHSSYGRGRGRGGGFDELPPGNFPPDFPQNLPPEPFHNGTRHDFSENYPYHNEYRGYSGWEATGHWSTPREDEYGYGLAGYERRFGEGSYGDVAGRYGFGKTHDDRYYCRQQRETTGKFFYGLSAAAPDAFHPRLYGDGYGDGYSNGYDIPVDSGTPQQQQRRPRNVLLALVLGVSIKACLLYTSDAADE